MSYRLVLYGLVGLTLAGLVTLAFTIMLISPPAHAPPRTLPVVPAIHPDPISIPYPAESETPTPALTLGPAFHIHLGLTFYEFWFILCRSSRLERTLSRNFYPDQIDRESRDR